MQKVTVEQLDARVRKLETTMQTVQNDVTVMRANTDKILDVITASKTITTWAKRIAPPLITFAIGAGYLNPNLGHALSQIFGG